MCNTLDSSDTICLLLSKLPGYLRDRWNRKVLQIRKREYREPSLRDLVDFFSEEFTLVNDPIFSKEALSIYENKKINDGRRHLKSYATIKKHDNSRPVAMNRKCLLCPMVHDLDNCNTFNTKSVQERSQFPQKQKLCYGCYEPISIIHNARSSQKRRICKICKEKHPTGLHGF